MRVDDPQDAHYFDTTPSVASKVAEYEFDGPSGRLKVASDTGVFSRGALDKATAILIGHIHQGADLPAGDIVDVGCGAGPIALALAQAHPSRTVWAIDTNERAVSLTRTNAEVNGLTNIKAVTPDGFPQGTPLAAVWSNPPIRVGKQELHALLELWLGRVTAGGSATLVVGRHLGADSLQKWLDSRGWPTTRLGSSKGFRVLRSNVTDAAG